MHAIKHILQSVNMLRLDSVILAALISVSNAVEFVITNNEVGPIWVGIQGNAGKPPLEGGGFELGAGQTKSIQAPEDWAGRFWARTWCDHGSQHCLTGDCGNRLKCGGNGGAPPVSLAEITLKGHEGIDFYDISLVDGYNLGISFEPIGGRGDGGQYSCRKAACFNFRQHCPPELRLDSQNGLLACNSACNAFNTDEYCCRGAHDRPETCRAQDWPRNYPAIFKQHCPDAYSYAYDDNKSTFTCRAQKYQVVFGGSN